MFLAVTAAERVVASRRMLPMSFHRHIVPNRTANLVSSQYINHCNEKTCPMYENFWRGGVMGTRGSAEPGNRGDRGVIRVSIRTIVAVYILSLRSTMNTAWRRQRATASGAPASIQFFDTIQ